MEAATEKASRMTSSFKPFEALSYSVCAFHPYMHDMTRQVKAHHYCSHLGEDMHQCIIYDSDRRDAKLIGIEYIVTDKIFKQLPAEEKKLWHSHLYEVDSGLMVHQASAATPGAVSDAVEKPIMKLLRKTYGKTVHTWQVDIHPDLPIGAPQLMAGVTQDNQVKTELVKQRDEEMRINTESVRKARQESFAGDHFEVDPDADAPKTGKACQVELKEVQVKAL